MARSGNCNTTGSIMRQSAAIWLGLWLLLAGLVACAPPASTPEATVTSTGTPVAVPAATAAVSPTTISLAPTATETRLPTATPIPATPSATPTPQTHQADRIGRTSVGDTIPSTPTTVVAARQPAGIACRVGGTGSVNLREGPGRDFQVITTLASGDTVYGQRISADGGWLLIETGDQTPGWVSTDFITCAQGVASLPIAGGIPRPTSQPATPTATALPQTATPAVELSLDWWRGEYFDNPSLLNDPILIRQDPNLDFNWILDSPAPGIPADNFSVRWTRLFNFTESGDYRFFADVDDGVRLYVDGRQLIDAWNTEPPIIHFGDIGSLQPGVHTITVEYFESGGHARARVWVERVDLSSNNWRGAYFNNGNWQDPPTLVRQDNEIDFDWGNDSPTGALNDNNFTVRWTGRFFFDPGDYRFFADVAGQDQVKIYLDGWLLADDYRDNAGRVEGVFANVGPGNHTITIEYREDGGRSRIKVGWERE